MPYFNTGKIFLVPSFDLEAKEQERIERFLTLLDNSGVDLGFITWASAIKMFLFEALIATLIIPSSVPPFISIVLFFSLVNQ